MEEYLGKCVKIKTEHGYMSGKLCAVDADNGNIVLENESEKQELKFNDVAGVSLVEDDSAIPLKESDMYALFYEAFNVFGPFEDQLIYNVAWSLKKFFKDIGSASIKIIIGSDDIFGKIGLCFARLVWSKAQKVSVELKCELNDLNSLKYKNVFENSGGYFEEKPNGNLFAMILFACNRNGDFNLGNYTSNQILVLDIPKTIHLQAFNGLGLGYIPEHYTNCTKFYYLIDVGFGEILSKKYKLPQSYKNSLMRIDVNK